MKTTVTRNIGSNRNAARLWIEGTVLSAANWNKGDRFNAVHGEGQLTYIKDPNGKRAVAGRTDRPVIDTNTNAILDTLEMQEPGGAAKVEVTADRITVTKAPAGLAEKIKAAAKAAKKGIVSAIAIAAALSPFAPEQATAYVTGKERILVGCEFSGRVRDAFIAKGHDAISCDLLESDRVGPPHAQGDLRELLDQEWDKIIAFPSCTYLTSAALWRNQLKHDPTGERAAKTELALQFVCDIMNGKAPQKSIENPVGCISTRIYLDIDSIYKVRPLHLCTKKPSLKPTQTVQPYEFEHPESKRTCLWLQNLPPLTPSNKLDITEHGTYHASTDKWYWQNQTKSGQNKLTPSADRWKIRSVTYQNIANEMANQWG